MLKQSHCVRLLTKKQQVGHLQHHIYNTWQKLRALVRSWTSGSGVVLESPITAIGSAAALGVLSSVLEVFGVLADIKGRFLERSKTSI